MAKHAKRDDSTQHQFRSRVPADVIDRVRGQFLVIDLPAVKGGAERRVTAKIGETVKFSLATRDGDAATVLRAHALAHLERRWQAARLGPVSLRHKQTVALAGEVYRLIVDRFEEDPGSPEEWAAWKAFCRAAKERRIAAAPPADLLPSNERAQAHETFGADLTAGISALPVSDDSRGLEARFGRLVSWVLTRHALEIDASSRIALLRQIADAALDAGWALKRNASGDYRPDPKAARFPEFKQAKSVTLTELSDRWRAEAKPAPSTVSTWKGVVASLVRHLGHEDVARITPDDVVAWKDALLAGSGDTKALSPKTVRDSHLTALRTFLNFALANRLVKENVAKGIKVAAKRRAGERKLPYEDGEVARLLALSAAETNAARRWIPLLLATSGARVGEVAQLWAERIQTIDGVPCMVLRPAEDGGSFKNEGSERTVPLHPAVIEAGFLSFVESKKAGPLFYGKARRKDRRDDTKHASKGTSNRIASWIRSNGFTDPRKSPNHALRHWWKSAALRAGVLDSVADHIQGHAVKSDASKYRHFDLKTLLCAVSMMKFSM